MAEWKSHESIPTISVPTGGGQIGATVPPPTPPWVGHVIRVNPMSFLQEGVLLMADGGYPATKDT